MKSNTGEPEVRGFTVVQDWDCGCRVLEPARGSASPADGVETQGVESEIMICCDKRETCTRCQEEVAAAHE